MTALTDHLDLLARLPAPNERRAVRARLGLTQRQVAEYLGVTTQAVTAWERGVTPSLRHLAAYVQVLDQLRQRAERGSL